MHTVTDYQEFGKMAVSQDMVKSRLALGDGVTIYIDPGMCYIGIGAKSTPGKIVTLAAPHFLEPFLWLYKHGNEFMILFKVTDRMLLVHEIMLEVMWALESIMRLVYEGRMHRPSLKTEGKEWYLTMVGLEMPVFVTNDIPYRFYVHAERRRLDKIAEFVARRKMINGLPNPGPAIVTGSSAQAVFKNQP